MVDPNTGEAETEPGAWSDSLAGMVRSSSIRGPDLETKVEHGRECYLKSTSDLHTHVHRAVHHTHKYSHNSHMHTYILKEPN